MSLSAKVVLQADFTARNGVGAITVSGARVGDLILLTYDSVYSQSILPNVFFETTVSVDNQIQQISASNLSANSYHAFLFRPIAVT